MGRRKKRGGGVKDLQAAKRYAQALFEIARVTYKDEEIEAELEAFSEALKKSADLEKFFGNPQFNLDQKRNFIEQIYQRKDRQTHEILLNFFAILFEKHRFYLIHEIAVEFKRIADEARGQGVAHIKTAVPLDAHLEAALVSRIEKLAGYKIMVRKEVDPLLIGGVVVRLENKIFDGSVRHQIDRMTKELTKIRMI